MLCGLASGCGLQQAALELPSFSLVLRQSCSGSFLLLCVLWSPSAVVGSGPVQTVSKPFGSSLQLG